MANSSRQNAYRYFFYGTLCDADVRKTVLGHAAGRLRAYPAQLTGYRPVYAPGRSYPVLVRERNMVADGLMAEGVTQAMRTRLRRFEGNDYCEASLIVTCDGAPYEAWVFLPRLKPTGGQDWLLGVWQQHHKQGFLERLRQTPVARQAAS